MAGTIGGNVSLYVSEQTLSGDILMDPISTLELNISGASSFTGLINADGTEAASLSIPIDSSSAWTPTAHSYINSSYGIPDNVVTNRYTLYVNWGAIK